MKRIWVAMIFAAVGLICGCKSTQSKQGSPGYIGDTDPIEVVVAAINANNSKIPTLWCHHDFEATIIDEKKESHFVNGFGVLMYSSPNSMRLNAKKEFGELFDMGMNPEQFWLHMNADHDLFYWGNTKNIGKPCMRAIPIRPDLVMQVLGVSQIDVDLTKQPVPVMRFNNNQNAYMFVWQVQAGDHWNAQKEIWYDRQTKLPKAVMLFGDKGRVVLAATLSLYQPVSDDDRDKKDWAKIATHYELFFPDTGTKMSFNLSDMALSHKGVPKATSYRMTDVDDLRGSGAKVTQIDADCGN